ncbi:MAG: L-rhamnose/proton symporter RhaT [Verrucomicrobiota bacterium]
MQIIWGILGVTLSGLISGSGAWPMKLMKRYQFEHWWFVGMFSGLVLFPWLVVVIFCPNLVAALKCIPCETLWKANAWATCWGVANVLCGLCYVRIGMALTTAILSGVGICLGVTLPLVFKGSGVFHSAPRLLSPAGFLIGAGAVVALLAVVLAGFAGHERERVRGRSSAGAGNYFASLILALMAGALSCGYTFSFIYSQGPIISSLKSQGAGDLVAAFAVWALALAGGALVSVGYAGWRLTRNKSWSVLLASPTEFCLALMIGLNIAVSIAFLGPGMLLMGALGGSVGTGLQQVAWMLGGQGVGLISGEWHGVNGQSRQRILLAMGLLVFAALLMACGNFPAGTTTENHP